MFDLIIKNGFLLDGSGQQGFTADIGIVGERITAMGDLDAAQCKDSYDATGSIVSPGFIDVHTHSDYALHLDNRAESQIRQGVTTELVGLCGFSLAPCNDTTRKMLLEAFHTGFKGDAQWHSFAAYLDTIDSLSPATNIAALTGHAALRYMAMEGSKTRAAELGEVTHMSYLLDESITQGSFGLSTGLEYHPGKEAQILELDSLCTVVGRYNGMHAIHLRNRDIYFMSALSEALDITRNTGSRLQISHINPKFGRHSNAMDEAFQMISRIRQQGFAVGMDTMPTNWNHTSAKALLPSWANNLPNSELIKLLQSTEGRTKLAQNPSPIWQLAVQNQWSKIRVFNGFATLRHRGKTIEELRQCYGGEGWDVVCALLGEEGETMFALHLTGDSFFTEDIEAALQDPHCSVCSDTIAVAVDGPLAGLRLSPNAYIWCEEFLRRFVREKEVLSLPEAVRRLTSLPAGQIGLSQRGLLHTGYFADITIFRLENMHDEATLSEPAVYPHGIEAVFVNGLWAYKNGARNPMHSGQVLRNSPT